LYRWAEPTLSLGYFQDYDERWKHGASRPCAVVRRISGGGAIVHDVEWTYSIAVPVGCPGAADPCGRKRGGVSNVSALGGHADHVSHRWLYEAVHATIVELLAGFGVAASIHAGKSSVGTGPSSFLCFERRSPGDVLVGPIKVAGSAQRRNHAAVLQHGSLLLGRSPAAPELLGLREITRQDFVLEEVLDRWLTLLSERLQLEWFREGLSQTERERAAQFVAGKHAAERWIRHRGREASSD
jgi:lipoate-protein ligase A